jgi:hypothetical protein
MAHRERFGPFLLLGPSERRQLCALGASQPEFPPARSIRPTSCQVGRVAFPRQLQRSLVRRRAQSQAFVRQRRQHLKHHVAPYIGRKRLSDLTTPLVYDFDSKLREAGRSTAMRRKVLTNLKTMLTFAQGRGLVAQNVARGVRIKADNREATSGPLRAGVDFPTMAELNVLIENSTGRWRPFIITARIHRHAPR